MKDFPDELDVDSQGYKMPEREVKEKVSKVKSVYKSVKTESETGYCIRTCEEIPFNVERPFSYKAYKSWAQFENYDFPEKYCHRTGEKSNGKTSMANPIF